ncbi:hypothetical protein [Nocardia sp. NPDC049707]|uniref:hypothetical protein n=1 Tax=Nocardia sp. NPDC049707 TaxID=3154735 RepID=UPI0034140174
MTVEPKRLIPKNHARGKPISQMLPNPTARTQGCQGTLNTYSDLFDDDLDKLADAIDKAYGYAQNVPADAEPEEPAL